MSAQVISARELAGNQAVETMLASRATLRAARADFIAAVKAARAAGVDDGAIAHALLRDSAQRDDLGVLEALIAREVVA